MGVVVEPYHIVSATTKGAKKTTVILLENTVSIFLIRKKNLSFLFFSFL